MECAVLEWAGDNFCDDENNNPECGFDGGDCCDNAGEGWDNYCSLCECLEMPETTEPPMETTEGPSMFFYLDFVQIFFAKITLFRSYSNFIQILFYLDKIEIKIWIKGHLRHLCNHQEPVEMTVQSQNGLEMVIVTI